MSTKINDESRISIIERVIQAGATRSDAAKFAGISVTTLDRWIKLGETEFERTEKDSDDPDLEARPYYDLYIRIVKAEAQFIVSKLNIISKAASDGDYRAAARLLEMRYPERYGRQVGTGTRDAPFHVVIRSDHDLD